MTDNLRDRIAAVQLEHVNVIGIPGDMCHQVCQCGFDIRGNTIGELQRVWSAHVADAVIRELGLQISNPYKSADGKRLYADISGFISQEESVDQEMQEIREPRIAYVVTSGSYSDYEIQRVYLTREEAEHFVELRSTVRGYDECRIEEFPIGAGRAPYDGPGFRASWSITHDGVESEHCVETWLTGSYLRPVEKRGIQHNYRRFVMVEGIDRDQVLKVLRDAARQGRAEYEGVSSDFTFRMDDD